MNTKTRLLVNETTPSQQRWPALLCLVTLFTVAVANKYCAFYGGPTRQFQELSRLAVTVVILFIGKRCGLIHFPDLSVDVLKNIWPVSAVHFCGLIFIIGEIKELSTSVFILLSRVSIIIALAAELFIFKLKSNQGIYASILLVYAGAVLGLATPNLRFDVLRSIYVIVNRTFFVAYLVLINKVFDTTTYGVWGLLYYNSLISLIPVGLLAYFSNDLEALFNHMNWANVIFTACFVLSCIFGTLAAYAIVSCTFYNAVLTTVMVDCLKDVFVTYMCMMLWDDYNISSVSIIAVNCTFIGCLIYGYNRFRRKYNRLDYP